VRWDVREPIAEYVEREEKRQSLHLRHQREAGYEPQGQS
jgi:hypothetical protein